MRGLAEYCGIRTLEILHWNAGVFSRFPSCFQHDTLLRVHMLCLPRWHSEEASIERRYVLIQKMTALLVGGASPFCVRMVESFVVKPVWWDIGIRMTAFSHEFPESFGTVCFPRIAASHAYHGDGHWLARRHVGKTEKKLDPNGLQYSVSVEFLDLEKSQFQGVIRGTGQRTKNDQMEMSTEQTVPRHSRGCEIIMNIYSFYLEEPIA